MNSARSAPGSGCSAGCLTLQQLVLDRLRQRLPVVALARQPHPPVICPACETQIGASETNEAHESDASALEGGARWAFILALQMTGAGRSQSLFAGCRRVMSQEVV